MKTYRDITLVPDAQSEQLVQDYLIEYDTAYKWCHVRNICWTPNLTSTPPFRDICGIIHHPAGGYIIFCDSLGKVYRNWLRKHPKVVYTYNNSTCQQFKRAIHLTLPAMSVSDVKYTEHTPRRQILKSRIIWEMLDAGNSLEFIAQLFETDTHTVEHISKKDLATRRRSVDTDD